MSKFFLLSLSMFLLFASACTAKPNIYRWGEYQQLIFEMYAQPGSADPSAQVARLSEDVERTIAEGQRVPPGVHAHLGYMYFLQGNRRAAMNEFSAEKERFPESTVFVDSILKRLEGNAKGKTK